jgi:glucose/arabinose dehydrogenase
MKTLGLILAATGLFATSAVAKPAALHLVRVATFAAPVYATSAPGDPTTLYVVEQPGRIMVLRNGQTRATPFLDIRPLVKSGGEQGLLSVAFDPGYRTNHFFYVDYTDVNGDTRVVRYRSNGSAAVTSSAKQLLFVKDFAGNHNGGQLQFGPDKLLYWGNGDGGGAGDPQQNGQSLARPFAKIMRTNVRAAKPFWRVAAYGLRNPWRFSFDRANGDLYIGDVGQGDWEEIDYLKRGFSVTNFGWNRFEGRHVFEASTPLLARGTYRPPIAEYSHSLGCSVTGGYVYRGKAVPAASGRYFYGDFCSGTIWSLKVTGGTARTIRQEPFKLPNLSSFAEDGNGQLYLLSLSGDLLRLAG